MENTPTQKKAASKPHKKSPPKKALPASGSPVLWGVLGISFASAVIAIGAMLYFSQATVPPLQQPSNELAQMQSRFTLLERQMQAQAARANAPSVEVAAQLEAQQRIIKTLEEKLETMRRQQEGNVHQAQLSAMVLTLASLQQKVEEGAPLEGEITTLQSLVTLVYGQNQTDDMRLALSHLNAAAAKGVPHPDAVEAAFDAMVASVVRHTAEAQKNDGWRGWLRAVLARFITVRAMDKKGEGVDAILTRAEEALEAKDLAQALAILNTLPPQLQTLTQGVKDVLNLRISAQQAVLKLQHVLHDELRATLSAPAPAAPAEAGE